MGGTIRLRFRLSQFFRTVFHILTLSVLSFFVSENSNAACGGTTNTWKGTTTSWATTTNWTAGVSPGVTPNNTGAMDVVLASTGKNAQPTTAGPYVVGCFDASTGVLSDATKAFTISVKGDYFNATNANTLAFASGTTKISMDGTGPQSLNSVNDIQSLTITNTSSVSLTNNFRIQSTVTLPTSGTLYITGTIRAFGGTITIPAGYTVVIQNGGSLYMSSNLTINGTLLVQSGGQLRFNGSTVTVGSGGVVKLQGSSGNPAQMLPYDITTTYDFIIAAGGTFYSNYATISGSDMSALGIQVTGTIAQFAYTNIIDFSTRAITLNAGAVLPATIDNISFFKTTGTAPVSFDVSAYTGSTITLTNYGGDTVGATSTTPASSTKLVWSTIAPTALSISDVSDGATYNRTMVANDVIGFSSFAFNLNKTATATNITQLIITMSGSASSSDLSTVNVYRDTATNGGASNTNCTFEGPTTYGGAAALTDTLVSSLTFTGSPPKATLNIASGLISTGNTTPVCLHVIATASGAPSNGKTVQFSVVSSTDITNSQNYAISSTYGTPVNSRYTTISSGVTDPTWTGATSNAWATTTNWSGSVVPTTTTTCIVGAATRTAQVPAVGTAMNCSNATLSAGGTLDYSTGTTNTLNVYNGITVGAGFNFVSATAGIITMKGTQGQTISLGTAFPGNMVIANTGAAGSNQTDVITNSTINGTLTCTSGILNIPSGVTLTVLGNITVGTGCTISIAAGGTLAIGNGKTLTVNTGGILQIIGSSSLKSTITSDQATSAYNVVVNGTIKANYYTFDHLNTAGVVIASGATIDATNFLQNGTFSYPVNNNTTLLSLQRQIPGNALTNMAFLTNGSSATGTTNINTTGAASGTLAITTYSGNLSGSAYHTQPTYLISWSGQVNTISITQEGTSPATGASGTTQTMGRFGFKQDAVGASYTNANITTLNLTQTGTGVSTDISAVRLYADTACAGTGGTLLGTTTFTGNPAKASFTIASGSLVVPAAASGSTTKVCAYVQYDIASAAVNGDTLGVEILTSADMINSNAYAVSTNFPLTLGSPMTISVPTSTTWTGTTNTTWTTSTNWSNGVPTSSTDCTIPNTTNKPTITTGVTANCHSLTINGASTLTVNAGGILNVYQDFTNTGTLTNSGTFTIQDYAGNTHYITSSTTLASLNLATNGKVYINNAGTTITNLGTLTSTSILAIASGMKLTLPSGDTLTSGTIRVEAGGTLEIGNGSTFTLAGGTFQVAGTNGTLPHTAANLGLIQPTGGTGSFTFTATSGTLDLIGFQFDKLDVNGLNIGGTTSITNLSGGQFTNLNATQASVKAIQINTTGAIPATAANIAWTWGSLNTFTATANTPASSVAYKIISSTGCGSQTINFSGWDGDWYSSQTTFDATTKISTTACTVTLSAAASAVSLLSFTAIPYNAAVDVQWETNVERSHLGFNVYRTTAAATRFVQVNKTLIRNLKTPGSNRGSYRFIDNDVSNNQNYYYYIEDIDIFGHPTMHGPVFAAPLSILGTPPADLISQNSNSNTVTTPSAGTPATIPNPTYQDLGNGIVILSQTSKSLRIQITPPAPVFTTSAWNGAYQDVAMAGYSKMTKTGAPELPEKDVLIEVQRFATTAVVNKAVATASILTGHLISPVATYSINNSGVLTPSYFPDASIYSSDTFYPAQIAPLEFFGIENSLITINDKEFLKLKINPMRFDAVTSSIKSASVITIDIGLNGDNWNIATPSITSNLGPYSVPNTLRIDYSKSGMHQINYSDFINSQVDGPFANSAMSSWRLYYQNNEIPIEIYSATGLFSSGDYIRFYAPFSESTESNSNQVILSPVDLTGTNSAPKRIASLNSNPTGQLLANQVVTTFTKKLEQKLVYIDGFTLGDNLDHYFYKNIFSDPLTIYNTLSVTTALPEIDSNNPNDVVVKYYVRGELGVYGLPVKHHAIFSVGGVQQGEAIFDANDRTVLTFSIPASALVSGNNILALKLPGTYATGMDVDRVLVQKIEINYMGNHVDTNAGVATFNLNALSRVYSIDSFASNNIAAYDITTPLSPKRLGNMVIGLDASNITYAANFFIQDPYEASIFKQYSFVEGNSFYKPIGLSLNPGSSLSLKDSSNGADLIIYGDENLLVAAQPLIDMRTAQGMEVITVTPEQVYSEFSYGVKRSHAVRDFISAALSNWTKPPRYLLILGDGSNDPLDYNVFSLASRSSSEKATLPAPIIPGYFIDFSSDNYFVSTDVSHIPRMAVGRIPTNNPDQIKSYIEKIKKYESGEAAPNTMLKNITFFADQDTTGNFEHFNQMSQNMMSVATGFTNTLYDRTLLGSLNATKTAITREFNRGPLLISLVGHGASDRFGSNIYNTTDAFALANINYPIVVTWNCETAYYYDADKSLKTFGEELIYNPSGGAIVYLGSTTQTTPPAQAKLAQNFFSQLSSVSQKPWDGSRLGDILYQAKIVTGSGAYEKDIVNSFSIIGDPSLKLPSNLYKSNQYTEAAAPPKSKGLFGCSAGAADGSDSTPWHEGFVEWLIYMALIVFGVRFITRRRLVIWK